jgi:hypothetical protein
MTKAAFPVLLLLVLSGCASFRMSVDNSGLKDVARNMVRAVDRYQGGTVADPGALALFLKDYNPLGKAGNRDLGVEVVSVPLDRWHLSTARNPVHEEKLTFPSYSPLRGGGRDDAVLYLYYKGELEGKRVILWVPGYGVSDFAFRFIRKFFQAALDRDYAVLFATIPGHLERVKPGENAGEGLLSADPKVNLETVAEAVGELKTGMDYLRSRGVASFGGWGGSMGAAFLLLLSGEEQFTHLCLMIPVLDWSTIMAKPEMKPVADRLAAAGYDSTLVKQAYDTVSPAFTASTVAPDRILLLYARQDQLTPESVTIEYAKTRSINRILGYDESHSTILLNGRMFRDYGDFLDSLP